MSGQLSANQGRPGTSRRDAAGRSQAEQAEHSMLCPALNAEQPKLDLAQLDHARLSGPRVASNGQAQRSGAWQSAAG